MYMYIYIHVYIAYNKCMVDDLNNTSYYYILTCIEHITAHVVNSIAGNANKIVQVIQRQREKRKFV